MTLKIEGLFEKKQKHFESKTGQKGYEFTYQKGPQQMKNVLHEEKVNFLYDYITIYH